MAAPLRLGDILIAKGLISETQLQIALLQQKITGDLLGDALTKLKFVSPKELAKILAEQAGLEFIDLSEYPVNEEALKMVPKDLAERGEFIPIDIEEGRLSIGLTNPSNIFAVDAVTRLTKIQPKIYLVDSDSYRKTIESAYFFLENPIKVQINNVIEEISQQETVSGDTVTNITNLIIMDGIRQNATDIHITPLSDMLSVLYRIDGVLQHAHGLPKALHSGIVSRIKILAQLDIAEQRLPQDGSFSFTFLGRSYGIRVSTVPTIYGENTVLRVLAGTGSILRIDELGFDEQNTKKTKALFKRPHGIILITGPTGSGKTTTLYSALRELNLLEQNVTTVEDPVEYKLTFVRQTQINERAGYDFAIASRAFMRQDPDVILLGEIRDEETARMAVRASITGHLVLSTLHTNDAVTAIPRLLDMKVDRFLLSSSLLAVFAQRLIRTICRFCKEPYDLTQEERDFFTEYGFNVNIGYKGRGCKKCNNVGYHGRTVVGEIMIVTDEIKELIYNAASVTTIKKAAINSGMVPLRNDAVRKAAEGITTISEVFRVTG